MSHRPLMTPRTSRLVALLLSLATACGAALAAPEKLLRVAFRTAETSFDPSQINDLYSRTVTPHIFEALYAYDPLARPAKIVPLTATALPTHSDDWRVWTMQVRPGIYFADDPAFAGKPRELVAQDYVYAISRTADPRLKSPQWSYVESHGFVGLAEQRQRAIASKQPFDYDAPIAGLRALDRYTLQVRLREPRPRFIEFLAASDLFGGFAREVAEHYGDSVGEHPVGTGPFKLQRWTRASKIVLVRNPQYRERTFDGQPAADDAEGQALLARFKGRRLPMVDRVEVAIIEEDQPRWLAFLNGELDVLEEVPPAFINLAAPGGQLAPFLAKRGVRLSRGLRADLYTTFFNMDDPLVGGYSPEQVALRRAIALGLDVAREIRLVRRGQGQLAQSMLAPGTHSYDPRFRSELGEYSPARARALLDLCGYKDVDGDGWRERPDGSPLVLPWSIADDQRDRQIAELVQRDLRVLGLRVQFKVGKWPELLRAARAGQFSIWHVGLQSAGPDSVDQFSRFDSHQIGGQNMARFRRPEFDALYNQIGRLPDGPERDALFTQANRIAAVWMPYKPRFSTLITDLVQAPVQGYRRHEFWQEWWHQVDVDASP